MTLLTLILTKTGKLNNTSDSAVNNISFLSQKQFLVTRDNLKMDLHMKYKVWTLIQILGLKWILKHKEKEY